MKHFTKLFTLLMMAAMSMGVWASESAPTHPGEVVTIPTALGSYMDFNYATFVSGGVSDGTDGKECGNTRSNTTITFNLTNLVEQPYYLEMKTGASGLTAVLSVTITNTEGEVYTTKPSNNLDVANTGAWTPTTQHYRDLGVLPAGPLTLTIKVESTTGSYAGNYGYLALHGANSNAIPGETALDIEHGTHGGNGTPRWHEGTKIAYIYNGGYSIYNVYANPSAYSNPEKIYLNMKMDVVSFNHVGQFQISIYDVNDLTTPECQQTFDITKKANDQVFAFTNPITPGFKQIRFDYILDGDTYMCDYNNLRFAERDDEAGDDPRCVVFGLTRTVASETSTAPDASSKYLTSNATILDPSVGITITKQYGDQQGSGWIAENDAHYLDWRDGETWKSCYIPYTSDPNNANKYNLKYRTQFNNAGITSFNENVYFGYRMEVPAGYQISLVRLISDVLRENNQGLNGLQYQVKIYNNGTCVKTLEHVISSTRDMRRNTNLSREDALQNMTGTIEVKMHYWNDDSYARHMDVKDLQIKALVTYSREHPHMNLNTLCFPYQIDTYTGATFYTILSTEVEAGELTKLVLEEHVGALEAGVPYFYDPSGTELVCYYSGDAASESTAADGAFVGKFADGSSVPEGSYVTVNNQLYKCGAGVTMGSYRAYVTPEAYSRPALAGRKQLRIGGNNAPTGVESIQTSATSSQKILRDGQVIIIRGDKMYNVMGQEVR